MKALKILLATIWILGITTMAQAQSESKKGCSDIKRTLYVDDKACTNDSVQFDAGSFKNAEYSWDFNGDGIFDATRTKEAAPKFNYISAGSYKPYVVIYTDSCTDGVRNNTQQGVEIKNVVKPLISVKGRNCNTARLEMVSNGILKADSVVWTLYDTIIRGDKVNHNFDVENGTYEISVQTYYGGCVAGATERIEIEQVEATPQINKSSSCAPATVELKNAQEYANAEYAWYLNGKPQSTRDSFSFPIANEAIFDVSLSVSNKFGCFDSIHVENAIEIEEKVTANAFLETSAACSGDEIKLIENHMGASNRKVIWGDGSTDTITSSLKHTYQEEGLYTVQVVAFSEKNVCSDTLTINNAIQINNKPTADFNLQIEGACVPQVLEVSNKSMGKYDTAFVLLNNYDTIPFNDLQVIAEPGVHEVRLIVENTEAGCRSEKMETFKLNNPFSERLQLNVLDARLNDNDFEMSWNGVKNVDYYEVYRLGENDSLVAKTTDTLFSIANYSNDSSLIKYAVKAIDQCGGSTGLSLDIFPIQLSGDYTTDSFPTLQWTPFTTWGEELSHYVVERKMPNQDWEAIIEKELPHHIDRDFDKDKTLQVEYRVKAVRKGGSYESMTNSVSFKYEPRIFIPTAFSPNYDNVNDEYRIDGQGLSYINIQVFNEWGQRVFDSKGENIAWDGKYKGDIVEAGTYICVVDMEDPNGASYNFQNTITVIR